MLGADSRDKDKAVPETAEVIDSTRSRPRSSRISAGSNPRVVREITPTPRRLRYPWWERDGALNTSCLEGLRAGRS